VVLEHSESAGLMYRLIGVPVGLTYELADLYMDLWCCTYGVQIYATELSYGLCGRTGLTFKKTAHVE